MRISRTIALLFFLCPIFSFGQAGLLDQKIDLQLSNVSLEAVLKEIEKNYNLHFSYNPDLLAKEKNITVDLKNKNLGKALESIFRERGLRVVEKNSQLVVVPIIPELNLLPPAEKAKEEAAVDVNTEPEYYEISGMVLHRLSRRPMEGVRVVESRSLRSTKTGSNGTYQLRFKDKPDSLYLRFALDNFMEERLIVPFSVDRYHSTTLLPEPKKLDFIPNSSFDAATQTASIENDILVRTFVSEEVREATRNDSVLFKPGIQLSLFPPISTSKLGSGAAINNLSLNLLVGYSEGLKGLEIGGFLNIDKAEVTGLQAAGFANITGGPLNGIQASGFVNSNKGSVRGIQATGFLNSSRDELLGLQGAGFLNVHKGNVKGIQAAGFANTILGDSTEIQYTVQAAGFNNFAFETGYGLQAAGFLNTAAKSFNGLQVAGFQNTTSFDLNGIQVAGFINTAGGKLRGGQFAGFINISGKASNGLQAAGFMNVSENLNGVQVAPFFNRAKDVNGLQIAFINVANNVNGVSLGFLNLVKNGYKRLEWTYFANGYHGFYFKTGTRWFYNIFHYGKRNNDLQGIGYGLGFAPVKTKQWSLNIEGIGIRILEDLITEGPFAGIETLAQARADIAVKLFWRVEAFAGVDYNWFISERYDRDTPHIDNRLIPVDARTRDYDFLHKSEWLGIHMGIRLGK